MGFPTDPLKIVTELEINGVWQNISADVYNRDPVVITRGKADEGAVVDPGSCRLTLNNGTSKLTGIVGRYSPRNPRSDLYGKFGRNTPLRVSVLEGGVFLDNLSGAPDLTTTPDAAPVKITGDIDIRWEGEADWYASGAQMLIGKWGAAGNRSYHMRLENRALYIHTTQDGTVGRVSSMALPENLPKRIALRTTFDVDNGAGGATSRFYWAESMDGPWINFGGDGVSSGTFAIFDSTAPLSVSPQQLDSGITVLRYPFTGRCYRAEVRSGIDGTVVASPNFEVQAANTTSFTDSASRVWTVGVGAAITNRRTRFVGEVSEWPTRWEAEGSDGYVPLVASGIMRRLGQGQKALDSTLRRRIPSFKPLSYWPMEEGQTATQAINLGTSTSPLKVSPVNWAAVDTLPSSSPLPTIKSAAGALTQLYGAVPAPATPPTSWTVQFIYRMDTINPTVRTYMRVISTGTLAEWYLQWGTGVAHVIGKDADGVQIFDHATAIGTDLWGQWIRVQLTVNQNGANVDYQLIWQDVGGDAGAGSGTFAGTIGRPVAVASPPDGYSSDLDGLALGHISAWGSWLDGKANSAYSGAIDGWAGETAGNRMIRLSGEEALPLLIQDGANDHAQVGPQYPETLMTTIQDAADADGGILYENREDIGLKFRGRAGFYNQPVQLELDFNARGLISPVEPIDDDQLIRNDRTIERRNGGSAQAILETGTLSVQNPPLGVGTYDDSTTLNLYNDEQTDQTAWWYLRMGTVDEARYPSIAVDLARAPGLISSAADVEVGDRLTIVNPPEWMPPGTIDQKVEGYQETLSLASWSIEYNCTPHSVYNVGTIDGRNEGWDQTPSLGKADTDGTTLYEDLTTGETQVDVTVTNGPMWVQAQPVLTPNPWLRDDASSWNGSGGTVARVPAPQSPSDSAWALQFTPNGVASTPNAYSTRVTGVVTGAQYVVSGWVRCARTRSVGLNLNWYTGTNYTSTSGNTLTVPANTWTWFEATFTAPASVDGMSIAATVGSNPPATDVILVQGATIRPVLGSVNMPYEFPFSVSTGGEELRVTAIQSMKDTFTRSVSNGWGTSDFGNAWTVHGTSASSEYDVNGTTGRHNVSTKNSFHITSMDGLSRTDSELLVKTTVPVVPTGDAIYAYCLLRTDSAVNSYYFARLFFSSNAATAELSIRKRTPSETLLATAASTMVHSAGQAYYVRFNVTGSTISAKAWRTQDSEPDAWQVTATDTDLPAAGGVGIRTFVQTANTNTLPISFAFDDLELVGAQRMTTERSINGVVKTHNPGQPISLTHPAIVAL
jgi:hypothetical protein